MNELISSIIQISFDNLPIEEGWERYELNVLSINLYCEQKAYYFLYSGEKKSFNPEYQGVVEKEDKISVLVRNLRKAMYDLSPLQGAWYSCKITVYPTGKFVTDFNYNDKPNFTYEPDPKKYANDLNVFPREESLIPDWLNSILKAQHLK